MELQDVPGMTDSIYYAINKLVTLEPAVRYFHVTTRADIGQLSRSVSAIVKRNKETKNVEVVLYKELPDS